MEEKRTEIMKDGPFENAQNLEQKLYPVDDPVSEDEKLPPCPGKDGYGAIFDCPNCKKRFVKTGVCCPYCGVELWSR